MGLSGGLVDNGGLFPSASEMPQQSVDVGSQVLQSSSYATFAAFIAAIPSGGRGLVTPGTYPLTGSVTISKSLGLEFQTGATLQKSAAFSDAQALLISGSVTVTVDAPIGRLVLDGNQANGAAGDGVVCQSGATVIFRGGQYSNHKASGLRVASATTDVRCYDVECSSNISGTNTGNGFSCSQGKLRTWRCVANLNDRWGFFFDRTSNPGCRLDGYAFGNLQYGADIRSFRGHGGQFVCDSNVQGGLVVEFGGGAWEFEEIRAVNNGLGDSGLQLVTLNSNTTVNVTSAESWWASQTISGVGIPAGTTITGPVANGATTLTISQAATATGQTTVGIGKTSASGVQFTGASMCQVGKIIERNSSGYGVAIAANGSPQTTTISNAASPITASQTTIPTVGISAFPQGGIVTIGSETIIYEGVVGQVMIDCIRGAFGTTAATHADGATITQSGVPQSNSFGVIECNNLTSWDSDPGLFMAGGATRNHVGVLDVEGRTIAWSIGEGVGAGDHNSVGLLLADMCSSAIWRVSNGSNNTVGRIIARDCSTAGGAIATALLYFTGSDSGATTQGNGVHFFEHKTIAAPAPSATIAQASAASGNYIRNNQTGSNLAPERSLWLPSGAICESMSRDRNPANGTGLVTGTLQLAGGMVIPAGKATASGTFWSGTTALTMGTVGDGHLWFCLVRQSDTTVVAVSSEMGVVAATGTTNTTTAVTALSPSLPVGSIWNVTGSGIPVSTTLTITGSGTTGTLSNPATSSVVGDALTLIATWAANSAKTIPWTSSLSDANWVNYTPTVDTAVYLGLMIALGTGGSPALPSLHCLSYTTNGALRGAAPPIAATWNTTSLTTPLAVSTQTGVTNSSFHPYGYIS